MRKRLIIVSDTAVSRQNGVWTGYEPVVKEIEYFSPHWSEIIWLGYESKPSESVYSKCLPGNVKVIPLVKLGGRGIWAKLQILLNYPIIFIKVLYWTRRADTVHSRAPSHPAFIAMILSLLIKGPIYWHKYAGSWVDPAPFNYRLQRLILKRIVGGQVFGTINGQWKSQPEQLLSFENPAYSEVALQKALKKVGNKDFNRDLELIYVGSLSRFKGVHLVIEALAKLRFQRIATFHIVGIGDYEKELRMQAHKSGYGDQIVFHGSCTKDQVFALLVKANVLIIASESEGFPKVIAEAMLHGCIPVSTKVSCIDQYITKDLGFIIENSTSFGVLKVLEKLIRDDQLNLKSMHCQTLSNLFTYERYINRINNEILKNNIDCEEYRSMDSH